MSFWLGVMTGVGIVAAVVVVGGIYICLANAGNTL